ncbi:MAG: signal transduction histidine kinase [Akkermansiaceae bacterium]|jgi:signal transduction histidine kinase
MKNFAATLVLAPVVLLTAIAVFGLVEYRHSVTAEARSVAEEWAGRAPRYLQILTEELGQSRPVQLYDELPATAAVKSGLTDTGIPVEVLEAWEAWKVSGTRDDADRAAALAIHEAPSAISAPLVATLAKKIPDSGWASQWSESEKRRGILRAHPDASGFVSEPDGPAMIDSNRVLTPAELRTLARRIEADEKPPEWMSLSLLGAGKSMLGSVEAPLASGGDSLGVEIGIRDSNILYARYWRTVWWTTALISCALLTALAGMSLIQRTLRRERRLGDLKSQFVASVSHELRAPVSSMRLMADALDSHQVDEETQQQFHRLMSKEGARLSALIENVLDFARIEEGRKDYSFVETDLRGVVRDTVSLMELVATERKVTIETVVTEEPHAHSVDPPAIQQALINLLDNAIKFSPEGGMVRVTLSSDARGWQLMIEDQGPGVPAADRERIFERFTRLGNELRREEQGTGIGLSIVKHIAEAHRAQIRVENHADGGARFTFQVTCSPNSDSSHPISMTGKAEDHSNPETKGGPRKCAS